MGELGRSFSVDSLGDSTRSLLSPLYRSSPEPYLSEGPLDESSDEEIKAEKGAETSEGLDDYKYEQSRRSTRSTHSAKTSSSRNLKSCEYDSSFTSCNDESKSSIRRTITAKSTRSSKSHSSRRSLSALESRQSNNDENNARLSSWEEWLVRKTLQDREKAKTQRLQRKQEKEELERKRKEEEDKLMKAAEKRVAWVEEKNKVEVEKRRTRKGEMSFERRKKEEHKHMTELKSRENFTKWCQEKQEKKLETSRQEQENARVMKDKEIERKLKNEQAFDEWLLKMKTRPKPVHGSFGYTSGKLTGFYEWGTYPAPSYVNPIPWVPPKPHRNKNRPRGKKELQPPSPPLLFKELEERISQRKKANSHSGTGKNGKA